MSKEKPETPPEIQMTPVGFSPAVSEDAIGSVGGRAPLHEMQFPLSIPVGIMLITLIFSTVRDISGFNRRINDIDVADAPILEKLKRVPKQAEFIDSLKASLLDLAPTDPYAARIVREYFPQPAPQSPKNSQPGQTGDGSTPAK